MGRGGLRIDSFFVDAKAHNGPFYTHYNAPTAHIPNPANVPATKSANIFY